MTEDNIYVNEDCYLTTENIFNLHDYLYEGYVRRSMERRHVESDKSISITMMTVI